VEKLLYFNTSTANEQNQKRNFIINVKSLDREKNVAEKCSSMLDIILLSDCSNGKFTA